MLKSLHKNDTQTLPYIATKNWRLSNVANEDLILMEHSGSDGLPVAVEYLDYHQDHPLVSFAGCNIAKEQQDLDRVIPRSGLKTSGIFYPEIDPVNQDGTFQRVIYSQIVTAFYNNYRDPTKIWGLEEIDFDRSQTKRFVADKFKLFIVPQTTYGEKVLENTVVLYDTTTDNDYTVTDDGHCNLFAGTNLFSHQQEISHHPNEIALGFDYFCDGYNSNTGSPGGITILTASVWATPDLTASLYNNSASLVTWSYQLTNNNGFLLQRSTDSGSTWTDNYLFPSSSLQYVDTNVVPFSTYWYHVAATSLYGVGLFSNTGSVYIPGQPPLAPISLSVASGSAILTWTQGSPDTDYYYIEKSIDPYGAGYFFFDTSVPQTDIDDTVTASLSGSTYWYRVAGVNAYGTSSFSNTASITFVRPPMTPPVLTVVSSSALLTWTPALPVHDYYVVERSIDPYGVGYIIENSMVIPETYTDNDVTSSYGGTTYWYRVAGVSNVLEETSSYSNTASITFTITLLPPMVSNPADQTVYLGQSASFTVTASGDNGGVTPLDFQWYSGSTALVDTDRVTGSQVYSDLTLTSSLIINNCQFSDTGSYWVDVSTFVGDADSNTASLTILDNVVTVYKSDSASFGVTLFAGSADATPLFDAGISPLSTTLFSGSLQDVVLITSGSDSTSSITNTFVGGQLLTVVLLTSGSESTSSITNTFVGGQLLTVVLTTSSFEATASVAFNFFGGALVHTVEEHSEADANSTINMGLFSGSLSP